MGSIVLRYVLTVFILLSTLTGFGSVHFSSSEPTFKENWHRIFEQPIEEEVFLPTLQATEGNKYVFTVNAYDFRLSTAFLNFRFHKNPNVIVYTFNAVGSVVANTDQDGFVIRENDFDAYGNIVNEIDLTTDNFPAGFGGSTNDLLFSTKERDFSTGLDYFGFRYYDPVLGKFTTRDPSGYPDGPNNYLYVNNNPINWIDPMGLKKIKDYQEELKKLERQKKRNDEIKRKQQEKIENNPNLSDEVKKDNREIYEDNKKISDERYQKKVDEIKGKIQEINDNVDEYNFNIFLLAKAGLADENEMVDPGDMDDEDTSGTYQSVQDFNDGINAAELASILGGGGLLVKGGKMIIKKGVLKYIKEKLKRRKLNNLLKKKLKDKDYVPRSPTEIVESKVYNNILKGKLKRNKMTKAQREALARYYDKVAKGGTNSKRKGKSTKAFNEWRAKYLRGKTNEVKNLDDFRHLDGT